jgi:hypothetical protein
MDQFPRQSQPPSHGAALGSLGPDELLEEQAVTLRSSRRNYSVGARVLFRSLDTIYGKNRTLSKFKVLELVARVPYQSWEQVAYIAITHVSDKVALARRIHARVLEARSQQDNEQWHLLILEELIAQEGIREGWVRYTLLPQIIAFIYYQVSVGLYVLKPAWSYRLNADFEDHAEHEYMMLVSQHPEWEDTPFHSELAADYGTFASRADVFRQIGYDERIHKLESEAHMREPRFR